MVSDNTTQGDWLRREVLQASGVASLGTLAGCTNLSVAASEGHVDETSSAEQQSGPAPGKRIESASRLSPRDFHEENYEITHVHRRKEAIRTLLKEPTVNDVARDWIASFEAYEPLSNMLDMISIQGVKDYTVEGSLGQGQFDIAAKQRQVVYGLVDRRENELVAVQVNDPIDISWTEKYDKSEIERCRVLLEQPEVQQHLDGKDWWPMYKVGESITAVKDYNHGDVTVVGLPAVGDDGISFVSGYVVVTDPKNPEFLMVHFVDDFVRYPVQQLAREIRPNDQSVLGRVPDVPTAKRPMKTAENGFHRFATVPDQSFEQSGWQINWRPPKTMGVTFTAEYEGEPVFDAMNSPATYTAYDLPPRRGRNTLNWFFPDHTPDVNGHHMFWDIHSIPFGGPGQLGKVNYPERRGHSSGFRFKTHFHTGAQGRSSTDFHSGVRFGPYNYNIDYEFFEDGRFIPIWRRHGPGYVVESLRDYGVPENYEGGEDVVQQYISAQAIDVTPGTRDGIETEFFDGDAWRRPPTEFYEEGRPGTIVRFTNPTGPETIEIPLDRGMEIVVLKRQPNEIGPGKFQKTRVIDLETEVEFFHPAQYVDGDTIQGERVIAWLLLEGSMDEVPHAAGVTGYTALAELQLKGY